MSIIMSNDYGFGNNKYMYLYKGEEHKDSFESRFIEGEGISGTCLKINNKYYTFGEGKLASDYDHTTKNHEIHRVLLWKAMYEVFRKTKEKDFYIVVSCGMDSWKEDRGKKVLDFMSEIKSIVVEDERNKIKVKLNIKEIDCSPETLSGLPSAKNEINVKTEEEVLAFDIGTKNFQIVKYESGRALIDRSFSTEYGMNRIYSDLADRNKNIKSIKLKSPHSVKVYLKKTALKEIEPIPDVENIILDYLSNIIFDEIDTKINHLDISDFTRFCFLGGGTTYLERFLSAKYISNNPVFASDAFYMTAKGLLMRAIMLYKDKVRGVANESK